MTPDCSLGTVLTYKELDGIGPVQTVGAVGPDDPRLELVNGRPCTVEAVQLLHILCHLRAMLRV
jgi:hypothetical protein